MVRYISILRGINVGGKRKILMKDLKLLYQKMEFSNVITYIQSGNVIFDAKPGFKSSDLSSKIKQSIFNTYGFDVPVIIRTECEMKNSISINPFYNEKNVDINRLHLTFLAIEPDTAHLQILKNVDYPPDRFYVVGKDVFIACSGKYSDSKLTNQFFENKLKVNASTRNWKTVLKLYEMASG